MGNYGLIILTSVVGKILDSIVKDEISEYLEVCGKTVQSQYGFVKGRSCMTNLLEVFDELTSRLYKGEPMDVIYLDFKKIIDNMLHRRLLSKITAHVVRGK
eukprot:g35491.t1